MYVNKGSLAEGNAFKSANGANAPVSPHRWKLLWGLHRSNGGAWR